MGSRGILLVLLVGACSSSAKSPDGGPGGGGIIFFDASADSAQTRSCGGTVSASGPTPFGGFAATSVHLDVIFVCGLVNVVITDADEGLVFGFSLVGTRTAGATTFTGSQRGTATMGPIGGGTARVTTFDANVASADDPFVTGGADAQPIGYMQATFGLTEDGFSLTGTFSSPYCDARECEL